MLADELLELIKSRRSIRNFTNEPILNEDLLRIIDAARYAPSNTNRQPWKFIIIKNDSVKNIIAETVAKKMDSLRSSIKDAETSDLLSSYEEYFLFIRRAPVLIFALYKDPPSFLQAFLSEQNLNSMSKNVSSELMSTSMAIQNLLLFAHALGLGACCTTGPLLASEEIKKILDIRPPFEIAAIMALGKYIEQPAVTSRKSIMAITEVIE